MTDISHSATARRLLIVVPCYNEESVLRETHSRLDVLSKSLAEKYNDLWVGMLYVDDGSSDATWQIISDLSGKNPQAGGLRLAHNAGHQQALWAGLEWASQRVDAAISIDADLQDDVNAIPEMVEKWLGGADIVYGVRRDRPTDTFFKKHTAQLYYKLLRKLGGDVVYNHADYRLMSRRALSALMQYPERNVFLRGMVRLLGFNQEYVYYDRAPRFAGESKYPLRRMLAFAVDGITSFSVRPLLLITWLGIAITFCSFCAIVYALLSYAFGHVLPGWTSLLISVWFLGGAVLTSVGIIGIYVGKIYQEVKRRPRYFLADRVTPQGLSEL